MLGIDVGKWNLQCALRDPQSRKVLWEKEYPNTPAGIAELLKATPVDTPWVLEPTGRYSAPIAQQAQRANQTVLLAPPRKAKAFLNSLQSRAKTDKLDAKGLALYGLSQPLSPYPLKEATVEALDQLLSARRGLVMSCIKLQQQADELPAAREALLCAVDSLKTQIKELDKQIAERTQAEPRLSVVKQLLLVPGIGAITASAVASRLSQKQFSHPDQFVAYIGLDVAVHQSGQRKGQRGLTHQGDAELRRLLYCCAQSTLRCKESPFKAQYERERAKGLPTTAALCAVARKLAKLCWSLHKHGTPYDATRIYKAQQRAPKPKETEQTTISDPPLDNKP